METSLKQRLIDARDNGFTLTGNDFEELIKLADIVHCPECKYYYAPVCTFYKFLPMTSRKGFCYHGIKGKYTGGVVVVRKEVLKEFKKYMNPPEGEDDRSN